MDQTANKGTRAPVRQRMTGVSCTPPDSGVAYARVNEASIINKSKVAVAPQRAYEPVGGGSPARSITWEASESECETIKIQPVSSHAIALIRKPTLRRHRLSASDQGTMVLHKTLLTNVLLRTIAASGMVPHIPLVQLETRTVVLQPDLLYHIFLPQSIRWGCGVLH